MELTREEIKNIIPQRDPILLADSASLSDNGCESTLFVDPEMEIFKGHFPGDPVLPGVYIIEAMAQCADIFLLSTPENASKKPLFSSVSQMRFLRPVCPGDTLICQAELRPSEGEVLSGLYEFRVQSWTKGLSPCPKKIAQGVITLCLK